MSLKHSFYEFPINEREIMLYDQFIHVIGGWIMLYQGF